MRISDWTSDVCSSDLITLRIRRALSYRPFASTFRRTARTSWGVIFEIGRLPINGLAISRSQRLLRRVTAARFSRSVFADRKSGVEGKSVCARVVFGGRRVVIKKNINESILIKE